MNKDNYCNCCDSYWCDGRDIHCDKKLPTTGAFIGTTNCKEFSKKVNERKGA